MHVETLDNILKNHSSPILLKIDVEGFETEVLKGATNTISNENLKAIIIELNGSGLRYGCDEKLVHEKLMALDFYPYSYNPETKALDLLDGFGSLNTIYIRDIDFVKERVQTASKFKVLNQEI